MASAPGVTLPVKADPRPVISFCRIVARHLTALADELEQLAGKAAPDVRPPPRVSGDSTSGHATACGPTMFDDPHIMSANGLWSRQPHL